MTNLTPHGFPHNRNLSLDQIEGALAKCDRRLALCGSFERAPDKLVHDYAELCHLRTLALARQENDRCEGE